MNTCVSDLNWVLSNGELKGPGSTQRVLQRINAVTLSHRETCMGSNNEMEIVNHVYALGDM